MSILRKAFLITLLSILTLISNIHGQICNNDPGMFETASSNTISKAVYFYCPMEESFVFGSNSIMIFDEHTNVILCANTSNIIEQKAASGDIYYQNLEPGVQSTVYVQKVESNLYLASIMTEYITDLIFLNEFRFVFLDANLRPRLDKADIIFDREGPLSHLYSLGVGNFRTAQSSHECLMMSDGIHAITIISEARDYTDILGVYFPYNTHKLVSTVSGLLVHNIHTGAQVAGISGYNLFVEYDNLIDYLTITSYETIEAGVVSMEDGITLDVTHTNSMVEVPGSHWSNDLKDKRTILISHKSLVTIDLLIWDFEDGKDPEFVWRWPGTNASPAIIKNWSQKWDIIGDPLFGTGQTHDANIINMEKNHFIVFDNGIFHKLLTDEGEICGMSRVVEYKIKHLKNERFSAELVYSYPPISEYPIVVDQSLDRTIKGDFGQGQCNNFWYKNTYLPYFGSARRLSSGDTVITWYGLFNLESDMLLHYETGHSDEPSGTNMFIVGIDGSIKAAWNNTASGNMAYRIIPELYDDYFAQKEHNIYFRNDFTIL